MSYTYTINDLTVNPRGEWSINYERNKGQIFFRRVFTGDLAFFDADYDLIMAAADCDVLEFKIYCEGAEYWEGQFKYPYDFDIDEDSCVCVGTPEVVDEYSCIMDNYETEYEVSVPAATTSVQIQPCGGGAAAATLTCNTIKEYIDEIINAINAMNCALTLKSSFFWRDNFPNGTNYAGAYGGNNYITGAANRLEFVYASHNSGMRATSCGKAGAEYSTFKEWEELIRNRFNAYWFIDENDEFRIEHIYYFDPAFPHSSYDTDLNLGNIISNNGRSYAHRRNKYTYETGRLYDQEFFSWQHYEGTEGGSAHGVDFVGVPIFYGAAAGDKSDCVPGIFKEKEFATARFWSDIPWYVLLVAAAQTDTLQCDGWVIVDVTLGTPNVVRCETGILNVANQLNCHLSTSKLQDYYFTYDRIFCEGNMNSTPAVAFDTCQKHKLQEAIEFPLCCDEDPDPLDRIETELGFGEIKSMNRKQNSIEVELLYD